MYAFTCTRTCTHTCASLCIYVYIYIFLFRCSSFFPTPVPGRPSTEISPGPAAIQPANREREIFYRKSSDWALSFSEYLPSASRAPKFFAFLPSSTLSSAPFSSPPCRHVDIFVARASVTSIMHKSRAHSGHYQSRSNLNKHWSATPRPLFFAGSWFFRARAVSHAKNVG